MKRPTEQEDGQFEDLRKLIALKRYETPGEEYFENFLVEFHERQRAEMLRTHASALLLERARTWINGLGTQQWTWAAAGATCAAVIIMSVMHMAAPDASGDHLAMRDQANMSTPAPQSLLREF